MYFVSKELSSYGSLFWKNSSMINNELKKNNSRFIFPEEKLLLKLVISGHCLKAKHRNLSST